LAVSSGWPMRVRASIAVHQGGRGDRVAIKVTVELRAKPGRRDELKGVLVSLIAAQGPG
jgi:hypothetical protein